MIYSPGPLIVADSYMAMVLPDDMSRRIGEFIAGRRSFPFIGRDELVCMMYLYGRDGRVSDKEVGEVGSLAQMTAAQISQDVDIYINSSSGKLDPEYVRSKYVNRQLQLAVENKNAIERISGDPAILSDCFAQHVAYYKQDYFFGLYGPLKDGELTSDIRAMLSGRMVMACYNRKDAKETGMSHPLVPVYVWFRDQTGAKP